MAKRYSLLPSEVLERASTFDLVILDATLGYEQYMTNKDRKQPVSLSPDQLAQVKEQFYANKDGSQRSSQVVR
jgi:hypothetical protein